MRTPTPTRRRQTRQRVARSGQPGRPAEFERGQAVEAAMDLFWERGFSAVSVSNLARAMSLQRSSFYNSFGTRDAVFLEALQRYGTLSPDVVLDRLGPEDPVVPALVALLRTVCRVRARDRRARGCLVCNSVGELSSSDDAVGVPIAGILERRTQVVEGLLRRAVARGELAPPDDLSAAAHAYVTFLVGLNTISKVVRSEERLWAACLPFLKGLGIVPDGGPWDRPPRGRRCHAE